MQPDARSRDESTVASGCTTGVASLGGHLLLIETQVSHHLLENILGKIGHVVVVESLGWGLSALDERPGSDVPDAVLGDLGVG
jgi:hypothetical protein